MSTPNDKPKRKPVDKPKSKPESKPCKSKTGGSEDLKPAAIDETAEAVMQQSAVGGESALVEKKKVKTFGLVKLAAVYEALMAATSNQLESVGSWRRGARSNLKDLDFITMTPLKEIAKLVSLTDAPNIDAKRKRLSFVYKSVPIDVWFVTRNEMPYALLAYTGDDTFIKVIRKHAKRQGFKLNQYGLFDSDTGKPTAIMDKIKNEQDIFTHLKFEWKEPADRILTKK